MGVAIRKGQAAGEIARSGENTGPQHDYERNGITVRVDPRREPTKVSPDDFFSNSQQRAESYSMTDNVSDEQFVLLAKVSLSEVFTRPSIVSREVVSRTMRNKGLERDLDQNALGIAVRKGQAAGEIGTPADGGRASGAVRLAASGGLTNSASDFVQVKTSASQFFGNGDEWSQTYAMTDNVSDEQFEAVISVGLPQEPEHGHTRICLS